MLRPDGRRLDQIDVSDAVNGLIFDDAGALWVTTYDGMAKYTVTARNQN